MSSIERAIEKLEGEPATAAPTRPAQDAEDLAAARDVAAGARVDDQPPTADEALARAAPELVVELRAPDAPPAATRAAAVVDNAPPPARTPPRAGAHNYLHLDFERLAAAGHLVPNGADHRMAEEYQHIKRRLLGAIALESDADERSANLIMITSSIPGEGKTFTTVNLALSMTLEVDHTVLAIDTDIVKRDFSKTFGMADRLGLYDYLAREDLRFEDLLLRTNIPNLVLLPAGQLDQRTTERLASAQMQRLVREIATRYPDRVVLFDSPPVLATTSALALAPLVGQLVLVVEAGRTKQHTVGEVLQRLEGIPVAGVVLNKARQQVGQAYDYYRYYSNKG